MTRTSPGYPSVSGPLRTGTGTGTGTHMGTGTGTRTQSEPQKNFCGAEVRTRFRLDLEPEENSCGTPTCWQVTMITNHVV